MDVLRFRALRWIAAGLGVLVLSLAAGPVPAVAGSSSLDVGDQAVVNVIVRGRGNDVTVRVWDRPSVQVDYADEAQPALDKRTLPFGTLRYPLAAQIPPQLYTLRSGEGIGAGTMAPEEFPFAGFRPGPHDVVRIEAPEGSRLVVTVPAGTGILRLGIGGGQTSVEGYRGANLFVIQGSGRVQVTGATTTAFVQMHSGAFYAADSTFDRVRVRGIAAHAVFERCRSKQIEATSVTGTIFYDGGSFDPGLARFESQTGSIALGVTSGAQLSGRSSEGHVYTLFDRRGTASVDQRGDGEAVATVGGGGALVNAISGRGNVYFYDGSLLSRRATTGEWRQLHQLFAAQRRPQNGQQPRPDRPRRQGGASARARFPRL
ncbi:MAG TPA: hypothetical protein VE826_15050 [Dongiaceae bacterium]|nr:hypothetical protein [Dongiaceae bacterium]